MKKLLYVALLAVGVVIMIAPPVMAQEEKPFTIHGEVRLRGEYQTNASDFDKNTSDSGDFWPYRVRIAAEGRFAHNVSAWIEFQSAGHAGGTGTPVRLGNADVFAGEGVETYQGNVTFNQLWSKSFSLRIGRQEIVAGNELMLGDLDFYSGLSHDGFVGNWNLKKVNVMFWATRPAQAGLNSLTSNFTSPDNTLIGLQDGTQNFMGGYATWTIMKDQSIDVYLMGLDTKAVSNVQTVGARYAHDLMGKTGFFWDVEFAKQFGKSSYATDSKADGNVLEGWFGFNWRSGKNNQRFYGRIEQASGDKTSSTDKFEGFIPMFGDFHNRTGRGDWFVLGNDPTNLGPGTGINGGTTGSGLTALSVGYTGYFSDRHEFGAAFWKYKLDQGEGVTGNKDDDLGNSIDVWYGYNYSKNTTFTASLSQLKPGDALKDIAGGNDDSVMRLYGQVRLRF
jgi:hypothetical protein